MATGKRAEPSSSIPHHIAIIMDGNGRWANARGLVRAQGHREGAKRVDEIVTECRRIGVRYLTLYAFSTENWKRPTSEVTLLMRLLVQYLKSMEGKLKRNRVALEALGRLEWLPGFAQKELKRVIESTSIPDPALTLNLCLSYGGRQEIVDAVTQLCSEVQAGLISPSEVSAESIRARLYKPQLPDPDLMIRTGGEYRVSNFLLWQIAYSEIYVTRKFWPEFGVAELHEAISDFSGRERRFGLTGQQVQEKTGASLQ